MAGEKNIIKDEPVATELKGNPISKSTGQDVASGKDGAASDSTASMATSGHAASGMKGEIDQESVGEYGAQNPSTVHYNYYYPGSNGSFSQVDNNGYIHTDGSHSGVHSDNGSLLYYLPGYDPYSTLVGVDGQCVGQQPYFSSSGYLQHPVSYGSEVMPCYSWDSTYVADIQNGNAVGFGNEKYGGSTAFAKSNGLNSVKKNGCFTNKVSKSSHTQSTKPVSKVTQLGSDLSAGFLKGSNPLGNFSAFSNQKQGFFPNMVNYSTNGRMWNGNDRYKSRDKFSRAGGLGMPTELIRGPRAENKSASLEISDKKEVLSPTVSRDQYNLPDFQVEYEKVKFYVIKSYSEDDIHKCIKYDVWSSTPNGNKKLDATFNEAEAKADETGTRCPIFLFFSVNGSGQFVGLAEMMGKVDFNKDMDFWQLDKWNGFFPVKWHVIKDVPNTLLRHITLENNENKPVTHSRDTQEIGLKQGLEMLKIFKSYSAKTSLLDDFNFYENKERSFHGKKSSKPATLQMDIFNDDDFTKQIKSAEKEFDEDSISIINLTKNLSLKPCTQKKSEAVKNPVEKAIPSVTAP